MPRVPELSELLPSKAFAAISEVGLQPVLIGLPTAKFDGFSSSRVAGQEPAAGIEVEIGTRVALAFNYSVEAWGTLERPPSAPHRSPAPDVVGMELETAMARVTDADSSLWSFSLSGASSIWRSHARNQIRVRRLGSSERLPCGSIEQCPRW